MKGSALSLDAALKVEREALSITLLVGDNSLLSAVDVIYFPGEFETKFAFFNDGRKPYRS